MRLATAPCPLCAIGMERVPSTAAVTGAVHLVLSPIRRGVRRTWAFVACEDLTFEWNR